MHEVSKIQIHIILICRYSIFTYYDKFSTKKLKFKIKKYAVDNLQWLNEF